MALNPANARSMNAGSFRNQRQLPHFAMPLTVTA
jgi:hypothetical protein